MPNPYNPGTPDNDFLHGAKGRFLYRPPSASPTSDPIPFPIESIDYDWEVDDEDITHSEAEGAQVILDGIERISGTVTFLFDALNVPTVTPRIFRPRTYATFIVRHATSPTDEDAGIDMEFVALVTKFSTGTGPKKGVVRVNASFKSTGKITPPTTSFANASLPLNGVN